MIYKKHNNIQTYTFKNSSYNSTHAHKPCGCKNFCDFPPSPPNNCPPFNNCCPEYEHAQPCDYNCIPNCQKPCCDNNCFSDFQQPCQPNFLNGCCLNLFCLPYPSQFPFQQNCSHGQNQQEINNPYPNLWWSLSFCITKPICKNKNCDNNNCWKDC